MRNRHKIPIRLTMFLVACVYVCAQVSADPAFSPVPTDPLGHRLKLSLFEYAGASQGEPRIQLGRFKGILRDKITVLVEELPESSKNFPYLQQLGLYPPGDAFFEDRLSTEGAVNNYWEQSRSLLLFRGTVSPARDGSYFVQSRLYMGSLQGDLPNASISVRVPIRCDDFPSTSDAHSLILYYVLARDAVRMGDSPSRIIELLSKAQDKVQDLKAQNALSQSLMEIESAVNRAMAAQMRPRSAP